MSHRAHRPPATFPARRGMRASWFRGRAPHELEDGDGDHLRPAPDTLPAPAIGQPGIRTAFAHPTF